MKIFNLFLASSIFLMACKSQSHNDSIAVDQHTQSNAQAVSCKHLQLAIQVDFEQQQLRGCATWEIENKDADELHLDTDQLSIDSVLVDAAKVVFQKDATVPHLGERLRIPIQKNSKQVAIFIKQVLILEPCNG